MRFELFIAARYLRAKRRQAVVGFITVISIIGVMVGVACLVIALAITNGMQRDMRDRLLGSTSHVNLQRVENDGIPNWQALMEQLEKSPHVVAPSPVLYGQVLISHGSRGGGGIIKGIVPEYEDHVSDMLKNLYKGSADPLKPAPALKPGEHDFSTPPIILGKDLADTLGVDVGSTVQVISPQGELSPLGLVPKYQAFRVVGLFKSGFYEYDSGWSFARLRDTQKLFDEPDIVSVIEFKVDDLYKAPLVSDEIEKAAGKGFMCTNWEEQNKPLFRALRLEQIVTFIILALIVCVAALNILISLTMMVMEKTKDIAVLMSMGVKQKQIRRIFIYQGVLIGIVGTILGLIIGYAVSYIGGHYHLVRLSAEVYSIDYLPFSPSPIDGLVVGVVSIGISFLATIYPSWAASRILPAEALRYE